MGAGGILLFVKIIHVRYGPANSRFHPADHGHIDEDSHKGEYETWALPQSQATIIEPVMSARCQGVRPSTLSIQLSI
jgi:hypothetical protein